GGWRGWGVECYGRVGWRQEINHLRLKRAQTLDLRDGRALDRLDGPFDRAARSVNVRRVNSHHEPGRYNIPSVGVFVWRLKSYSVTRAPAPVVKGGSPYWFSFSSLGNDAPLYTKPEPSADQPHVRDDISVPGPIRRRELEEQIVPKPGEQETDQRRTRASARYYGEAKSVAIYAQGWPQRESPQ